MSRPADYRTLPFSINNLANCGQYLGAGPYWKLYSTENVVRSIVHSILSVQLGPNWLSFVIDSKKINSIQKFKQNYASQPTRSFPGHHDVYYLFLSDLSKIMADQSNLFMPVIPDINNWILKLESIQLPRNIVGHMNWLNIQDISDIRRVYLDFKSLTRKLISNGFNIIIP